MRAKCDAEGSREASTEPVGPLTTMVPAGKAAHPLTDNVAVGVNEDVAGGLARIEPDLDNDAGIERDGDRLRKRVAVLL